MKYRFNKFFLLLALLGTFFTTGHLYASNPSPVSVQGATSVSADEARQLWLRGAFFIDPRSLADWDAGRIPGALHMERGKPVYNPLTVLDFVGSKDAPIVAYCNAEECHRAAHLAKDLLNWGFTNVYYFRLGYPEWLRTGSPFE